MPTTDTKSYKDLDLNFIAHPITGDVGTLSGEAAVKQSLKNLILTNYYEKPYLPKYGGNLNSYLFEQAVPIVKQILNEEISSIIKLYEPRVELNSISVELLAEAQSLELTLYFAVLGITRNSELVIYLERVR